jgi:hypothetical protein
MTGRQHLNKSTAQFSFRWVRPLRKVAHDKFTHPQPLPVHREGSISAPATYCISCYWVWWRFSPSFSREGLGVGKLAANLVRRLFGAGS